MQLMKIGGIALALLVATTIVISCARSVTMEPVPEPEPEPLTLQGTWSRSSTFEEDGQTWTETQVLTFTGGARAIAHNAVYDATGALHDTWTAAPSRWSATDVVVTRSWLDDHDDDDETAPVAREVEKSYYWGADRDSVFLTPWDWEDPTSDLARYERVADPLPALSELVGRWEFMHEAGNVSVVVIGADSSISFTEDFGEGRTWQLTGTIGEIDPETLIAMLTDLESQLFQDGVAMREPRPWYDTAPVGFAPAAIPGGILISVPWDEVDPERHPYGTYWMELSRADS